MSGLSSAVAAERLSRVGPNALPERPPDPLWRRFVRQFESPLIYILLFALAFDLGLWFYEGAHGLAHRSDGHRPDPAVQRGARPLSGTAVRSGLDAVEGAGRRAGMGASRWPTRPSRRPHALVPGDRGAPRSRRPRPRRRHARWTRAAPCWTNPSSPANRCPSTRATATRRSAAPCSSAARRYLEVTRTGADPAPWAVWRPCSATSRPRRRRSNAASINSAARSRAGC